MVDGPVMAKNHMVGEGIHAYVLRLENTLRSYRLKEMQVINSINKLNVGDTKAKFGGTNCCCCCCLIFI